MNKKNPNTEEILDAIKNMMSENNLQNEKDLPKDVIKLTNPVNENTELNEEKLDILELSNPINDTTNTITERVPQNQNEKGKNLINDEQIRQAVKNAIESLPSSKIDEIINEVLTKIIQERLNSSSITISTEDKKN